jgi:hypothetical protein
MANPFVAPPVTVYAGDTLIFPVYQICDSEEVPVDLSAWTWRAHWRKSPTSSDFIELNVDSSDSATGIFRLSATPEQTTAMNGDGVWDLEGTQGLVVDTPLAGSTVFRKDVTR